MAQSPGEEGAPAASPPWPPPVRLDAGAGGAGEDRGADALDAAPGGADDAPDAPSTLPCLDSSHPPSCSSCTPAPDEDEVAAFELVGDQGRKNGEKRLKSLLSKTPQWRSKDERAAAAAACDASGYANLASVLRNDVTSAALRKRDMIALARHWSYRSHIWRRRIVRGRGERTRRAAPAAAEPEAAAAAAPGAPWLLDDVSPAALALALADWDADDLLAQAGPPPWEC